MKILPALLAAVLLAGCAVVPMAPAPPAYYPYGPTYYYYPGRYYYYPGPYYGYPYYPFYGRPAPVPASLRLYPLALRHPHPLLRPHNLFRRPFSGRSISISTNPSSGLMPKRP